MRLTSTATPTHGMRLLATLLCGLTLLWVAQAADAGASTAAPTTGQPPDREASASLLQCINAATGSERSVTFTGEMKAVSGTTRMSIRVEVLERKEGEATFHTVTAPGIGVWRTSAAGVKVFKYLKQITNLAAPAVYRAQISFHWRGSHARVIKRALRKSPICTQALPQQSPSEEPAPPQPATPAASA